MVFENIYIIYVLFINISAMRQLKAIIVTIPSYAVHWKDPTQGNESFTNRTSLCATVKYSRLEKILHKNTFED